MSDRFTRALLLAIAVFMAVFALGPYIDRWMYSSTEPRPVAPRGDLAEFEKSSIAVFRMVTPSVVQVAGVTGTSTSNVTGLQTGSGFIWDAAGHLVTNDHVVAGAQELAVRLSSGETLRADLVGRAPNYDLAVLRLRQRGKFPPPVTIGSSANLVVGQAAYAIGNPFGLDHSLTFGIISALDRRLPTSGGREIAGVIQTDAAINPGNSGGPLLDSAGRLIGVNTAIFSPSGTNAGIGFAIPVDRVNRVVPQLIKNGRVPTPGIGIIAADEAVAAQAGINGVIIAAVRPGSPAAKAGLQSVDPQTGAVGDVIIEVDGIDVNRLPILTGRLEEVGVGGSVELAVVRDGQRRTVKVIVADIGS
jgi:S1-C subfamily serine protease